MQPTARQRQREDVLKILCARLGFAADGSSEDIAARVEAGMGWGACLVFVEQPYLAHVYALLLAQMTTKCAKR